MYVSTAWYNIASPGKVSELHLDKYGGIQVVQIRFNSAPLQYLVGLGQRQCRKTLIQCWRKHLPTEVGVYQGYPYFCKSADMCEGITWLLQALQHQDYAFSNSMSRGIKLALTIEVEKEHAPH